MSPELFAVLAMACIAAFILCCVGSAVLQIMAWSRHTEEGVKVRLKALWRPEGYFDPVGVRQIRLARTLLIVGGCVYLAFGVLVVAANVLAA